MQGAGKIDKQSLVGSGSGKENNQPAKPETAIEIWTPCGCPDWPSSSSCSLSSSSSSSLSSANCKGSGCSHHNKADDDADGRAIAEPQPAGKRLKLSRKRWAILAGLCIFGFLDGLVNEFTAILSMITDLLGWKLEEYVYMSQIFSYTRPLVALPCAWLIDRLGLKRIMYLAMAMGLLRNTSRMLLFSPHLSSNWEAMKFVYWSVCALSSNIVISIYYSLPLKVSESWFPQRERSLAFTLMSVFPSLGGAISSLVLPRLIEHKQFLHRLATWNLFASLIMIVVVLTTITRSRPRQAPSQRSSEAERNLQLAAGSAGQMGQIGVNLRNLLTNFHLMLHILTSSTFGAMGAAVNSIVQDVLASCDLSETFCGNFLALNGVFGAVIQIFSSRRLDRTPAKREAKQPNWTSKQRTLLMKVLLLLQYLCFALYLGSLSFEKLLGQSQWALVVGSSLLLTSVGFWAAPFHNDLVADLILLSPVSQATVSAASGAIWALLNNPYQMMFVYLRRESSSPAKHHKSDYSRSMLFAGLIVTSVTFTYVTCFVGPASQCDDQQQQPLVLTGAINESDSETNKADTRCRCCCGRRRQWRH